jgi:putative CocE/NonD family hydrolase
MRHVAVAFAILASLVVAGCLSDTASQDSTTRAKSISAPRVDLTDYTADRPVYSIKDIRQFVATAEDGTKLLGHVYIPDAPEPLATVLEYSPYHNSQGGTPSDQQWKMVDGRKTMTGGYQLFLDAGYAVALVNLRGTGQSGSCFHWGNAVDVDDVTRVIDMLGEQAWSNGAVGMIGTSWPGWTQYLALAGNSSHLKAVIPVSGVMDGYSVLARNGAPLSIGPIAETLWNVEYSLAEVTYLPVDNRGGPTANHMECGPRYGEDLAESAALITNGDRNKYWNDRDTRKTYPNSRVPILFTNGLTDGEGHILQFEGLWESIHHEDKRMLIGQWPHGSPQAPPLDWPMMRLAWFDHYLRGEPMLLERNIVEVQDDTRQWHTFANWPPARTDVTLYLSDGAIVADPSEVKTSTQVFQSIDANPCPGFCTAGLVETPHEPVCGPTQALYVSPPVKEDVLLAGNFHVNFTLSSTQPDGNLAVFLYRTTGDGICPDMDVREVRRALTDLRHARAPGAYLGQDFFPLEPTQANMVSHPFASPIKAGERFVIAIGGGSTELTPDARKPALTVTTGPSIIGQITIPVVEGTLAFE